MINDKFQLFPFGDKSLSNQAALSNNLPEIEFKGLKKSKFRIKSNEKLAISQSDHSAAFHQAFANQMHKHRSMMSDQSSQIDGDITPNSVSNYYDDSGKTFQTLQDQ